MITQETLEAHMEFKSKLDDKVSEIFSLYCSKHKIHWAYGIESYEIDTYTIDIKQDTSSRGCYDFNNYSVPLIYLYMSKEEISKAIGEEVEIKRQKEKAALALKEIQRKKEKRAEYERLKKEFGDK